MSQAPGDIRTDQLAPHSIEAEEAVLGSILISAEALFEVLAFLKSEDFFIVRHAWIYEGMMSLHERRDPIDYLTVVNELEQMGRLPEIGGAAYILSLINKTPSTLNVEGYGRIVERMALRRRLIDAASQIARVAHSDETDIDTVIGKAEQAIFAVTERRLTRDLLPIKDAVSDYFDHVSFMSRHQEEVLGVPTGFVDLDRMLGGLQRSDLLIVAARPGMGKTAWLNSVVMNAARQNQRAAIFSLEMSNEQLVQRFVSAETHIPSHKLREGKLDEKDWAQFLAATQYMGTLPIFMDDTPALSTSELRTKARRLHLEYGLDLIVIDYLQLMTTPYRSENRVQEISYISRALKQLARELNVPVVSAAQLSRAVEQRTDKRPQLSDLRESGCLAGDTPIWLPDQGRYVAIRDLSGKRDFTVLALNPETWKLEHAQVSNAFCTGTKPVYRLTTKLGRTIRATANHKFLTIDGWKRLDELALNEQIAVPRTLDATTEQTLTDAELGLLGHLIGDGCTLPTHAVQYTTREHDLALTVAKLAKDVFGDAIEPRVCAERTWYQVYLKPTQHLTHGVRNPVGVWMEQFGLWGKRSYEKFIPDSVFSQPPDAIRVFLRHLWATDGCIKVENQIHPRIFYATSSHRLAVGVQLLLLRIGINARLKRIPQQGKGRDQYHVLITGRPDFIKFVEIGAVGNARNNRLDELKAYIADHYSKTNRDVIPSAVWHQLLIPAMQAHGLSAEEFAKAAGHSKFRSGIYSHNLSRERADRFAEIVHSVELRSLATSDIYWDQIGAIDEAGVVDVHDLTVPNFQNFVTDCVICHNSIEQDSDVVMFIYRDAYYNPDSPQGNIAEIHVAKHRHGPTGTVELIFIPQLTQFQNAARHTIDLDQI